MNDRELLELAAKAAGIEVEWNDRWNSFNRTSNGGGVLFTSAPWDPLVADGDALRLAVKLNLHICIDAESSGAITVEWGFDEGGCAQYSVAENSQHEPNDCAATRRAIVRAAAAIGEAMQ